MKTNAAIIALLIAVITSSYWAYSNTQSVTPVEDALLLNAQDTPIQVDAIHEIEVVQWPAYLDKPERFHAKIIDGAWVIPDLGNFPADLAQRLGPILGSVINLKRGPIISSDPERHAELRIANPLKANAVNSQSYGQCIQLKDKHGNILVDLIFGRYDQDLERSFVRQRGDDSVYTTTAFLYLEAHWSGWIQRKLLPISINDMQQAHIQGFSDKPYQTNNAFTFDNQTNTWQLKSKRISPLLMRPYLEDITESKIQGIYSLQTGGLRNLAKTGFTWEDNRITKAPITHSVHGKNGVIFTLYISHRIGNKHIVFVDTKNAEQLSSNYQRRLKHFAFSINADPIERLQHVPKEFLR